MATRSFIGYVDGEYIKYVYCHSDGYLDGVGKILKEHYDFQKTKELISFGAISVLGPNIGTARNFNSPSDDQCLFYGRDRGDANTRASSASSKIEYMIDAWGVEYVYLLENGVWTVKYGREFVPL